MDASDFEGSLVLERLAELGMLDDFYEAVDVDDIDAARALMRRAGLDAETIATVVMKMSDPDGEH